MAVKKKRRVKGKKKKVGQKKKVRVTAKSRATGKAPTARLKKRRTKNTTKGYYPNPTFYVAYLENDGKRYFYHGYCPIKKRLVFDDREKDALWYRSRTKAINEIGRMMQLSMTKAKLKKAGKLKVKTYSPK